MIPQLGRDICAHLPTAETREWLVTNGIGGYACGTVAGLLTRHYHGLLVAALKPPLERTLLVAKLDEQVRYDGESYELATNRWADGSVSPQGYRYIEQFELVGTVPTWVFAVGDALLEKSIWMEQRSNTTYIRYMLKRGSGDLHLSLKALVNYRNHHGATYADGWKMQIAPIIVYPKFAASDAQRQGRSTSPNDIDRPLPAPYIGVKVTAFDGATPVSLMADAGMCLPHHEWYRNYDLAVERDRGINPRDDHLHCVTFEAALSVGQVLTIVATTAIPETIQIEGAIARQQKHEHDCLCHWHSGRSLTTDPAPDWIEQLVLAADQFIVARPLATEPDGKSVIAGFPWFGDWGRDTMIALPGLTLATGRPDLARLILRTFAKYLDQGMLPNLFPEAGVPPEYNTVDAILWFFEAIRAYYAATQDKKLVQELFPALVEVIRWHQQGTRYQIHLDSDGLLYAGETGVQLTWMDAKVGDWVITPRIGKPIEVNALWYNALLIMAEFAQVLGVAGGYYLNLANQTRQGMQRFWSDHLGYCYDVLDGPNGHDSSLRPNQIFAVAFPRVEPWASDDLQLSSSQLKLPLFSDHQQKAIVDTVARHLLTSYGLRSLATQHPDYCGHYGGDPVQRDSHYHQGPVWGWLMGPFVQAHLQVYLDPVTTLSFLEPMAANLHNGCMGTLNEIFDGDPPHEPCGAFAQAWTVAEALRAWCLIDDCLINHCGG